MTEDPREIQNPELRKVTNALNHMIASVQMGGEHKLPSEDKEQFKELIPKMKQAVEEMRLAMPWYRRWYYDFKIMLERMRR